MRQRKFDDAANTASRIEAIGNPVDGWEKRAEALMLADRSQEVLDDWEVKKSDPRFGDSMDVLSLVARAFSERHRTDKGLEILNNALTRHQANARLLSEHGLLMENLGKLDE